MGEGQDGAVAQNSFDDQSASAKEERLNKPDGFDKPTSNLKPTPNLPRKPFPGPVLFVCLNAFCWLVLIVFYIFVSDRLAALYEEFGIALPYMTKLVLVIGHSKWAFVALATLFHFLSLGAYFAFDGRGNHRLAGVTAFAVLLLWLISLGITLISHATPLIAIISGLSEG